MGRCFPIIDEWEKYIPDVDDEREFYAQDPDSAMSMELRFLSKKEREKLSRFSDMIVKGPNKRAEDEIKRILDSSIRDIKNYSVGDVLVETGSQFWEICNEVNDLEVLVDVTAALCRLGRLSKGLAKKLGSPSVLSTAPQKIKRVGDAHIVTNPFQEVSSVTSKATIPNSNLTTSTRENLEIVAENSEHLSR